MADTVRSTRRLSAEQRRHQLVGVAGELFAEHGYHGLSMEQLADAAGVSKPVLYQHFPSKRNLYLALVQEATSELRIQVKAALEGTQNNRDRVFGAIAVYFDFVEDPRFQLLFATAETGDDAVRVVIDDVVDDVGKVVAQLIASDAGLNEPAALFLAFALRGLAMEGARWWAAHPEVAKDEAVELLARLIWRGLGAFEPDGAHTLPTG